MEIFCIAVHFLFVQYSLGIFYGMTDSDVSAVKLRLEEEKEKRLLLENDIEILMLKVANLTRTVEKIFTDCSFRQQRWIRRVADVLMVEGVAVDEEGRRQGWSAAMEHPTTTMEVWGQAAVQANGFQTADYMEQHAKQASYQEGTAIKKELTQQ